MEKVKTVFISVPWYTMKMVSVIIFLFPCLHMAGQTKFQDVTAQAGIEHQFKVYEGMFGGGACVFDINNDGFEDLFITSGMNEDALYLNNGDGTFKNIYQNSGLEFTRHFVTQGVAGADVNRDGWVDLFITTITSKDSIQVIPRAKNLLFLNNGDLTFTDATEKYRLDKFNSFSTGVNFGDVNTDGYPDVYIGNYFLAYDGKLSTINDATIVNASQTSQDYLLINKGGKYFENEYASFGFDHEGFGFGGVFTDFDNDGDQDLIVNNDFGYKATPNFLMVNEFPKLRFSDASEETDMDLKINSMGTAIGDYNGDGLLDYFFTNIRFNWFMENQGAGKPFKNIIKEAGLGGLAINISWGANFADFDHDGDVDLFVANGDLNPNCRPMANYYFENESGQFTNTAHINGLNHYGIGRGSVVFDIENDGDLDLLVINQESIRPYPVNSTTRLYRNDSSSGNWIKVKLAGKISDLNGIGSKVEIFVDGARMIREVDGGGSSHLSQNSTISHFGVGNADKIDSLIITWASGHRQKLTSLDVNRMLMIAEDVNINASGKPILYWILLGVIGVFLLYLLFKKVF